MRRGAADCRGRGRLRHKMTNPQNITGYPATGICAKRTHPRGGRVLLRAIRIDVGAGDAAASAGQFRSLPTNTRAAARAPGPSSGRVGSPWGASCESARPDLAFPQATPGGTTRQLGLVTAPCGPAGAAARRLPKRLGLTGLTRARGQTRRARPRLVAPRPLQEERDRAQRPPRLPRSAL